jgi:ADP-ribose pyrophosphatase YjhB (NUDIX family)
MTSTSRQNENPNPRVGVGVLLVDEAGRVLLTLRERPPEAGCWSIVGGKVDYLETLEQCAVRETREEVGVEIRLVRLLCVTDHHLPHEGQHWVRRPTLDKSSRAKPATASRKKRVPSLGFRLASCLRISPLPPETPSPLTSASFLTLPTLLLLRKTDI